MSQLLRTGMRLVVHLLQSLRAGMGVDLCRGEIGAFTSLNERLFERSEHRADNRHS